MNGKTVTVMEERMASLKVDTSMITLEGFFLADYQSLRERIKELEQEVQNLTPDGYGCTDQHRTCEAVRVDVVAQYQLKYMVEYGMTIDQLKEAYDMTNDELERWASRRYTTSGYGSMTRPIDIGYHTYQYTLTFRETRGTHTYVTDGERGSDLVEIDLMDDNMAGNLGQWCRVEHLENLKQTALEELRDNLGAVIASLEKQQ